MNRERFALALERLGPGDGVLFEQIASAFSVVEFGALRTIASRSGDGGRDAYLYSPDDDDSVVLQYSVTQDFSAKIRQTARRLGETCPNARELIYVTSQAVGIKADEIRQTLRQNYKLRLDVWDRNWFLDRVNTHPQREQAAEDLARIKVDPLLSSREITSDQAVSLESDEERTAALFLALQYADDDRNKGLTKVCFDSLVRAALRGTDSTKRITRAQLVERVQSMVPTNQNVAVYVDGSLRRLDKTVIRNWRKTDEFCLVHEEVIRINQRITELELNKEQYRSDIARELKSAANAANVELRDERLKQWIDIVSSVVDRFLSERGEIFAASIARGAVSDVAAHQIEDALNKVQRGDRAKISASQRNMAIIAAQSLLMSPGESTRAYLQRWSDAYTLFFLLRETADVQRAVVKLFSSGRIWIDANLLLPVLAEELADPEARNYTHLLAGARDAGLSLRVTEGVIEELAGHMRRSLAYVRTIMQGSRWDGDVPFLYAAHALSGRSPDSFAGWIENFRGDAQPEDDVKDYLQEVHNIRVHDLADEASKADVALRGAVQEIWIEARSRRTRGFDPIAVRRLVDHDVQCYIGIIQMRRGEKPSALGYNSWWLTLDKVAYRVHNQLKDVLTGQNPAAPVMSPDFLLNCLEVGPLRSRLKRVRAESGSPIALPLMNDVSFLEGVSPEVLRTVENVRKENEGLSQRVLRRKIRDSMNSMRSRRGVIAEGGVEHVEAEVLAAIEGVENKL